MLVGRVSWLNISATDHVLKPALWNRLTDFMITIMASYICLEHECCLVDLRLLIDEGSALPSDNDHAHPSSEKLKDSISLLQWMRKLLKKVTLEELGSRLGCVEVVKLTGPDAGDALLIVLYEAFSWESQIFCRIGGRLTLSKSVLGSLDIYYIEFAEHRIGPSRRKEFGSSKLIMVKKEVSIQMVVASRAFGLTLLEPPIFFTRKIISNGKLRAAATTLLQYRMHCIQKVDR
ncbi:hypothetical protein Tco_1354441 [Tanacetum coccineum]